MQGVLMVSYSEHMLDGWSSQSLKLTSSNSVCLLWSRGSGCSAYLDNFCDGPGILVQSVGPTRSLLRVHRIKPNTPSLIGGENPVNTYLKTSGRASTPLSSLERGCFGSIGILVFLKVLSLALTPSLGRLKMRTIFGTAGAKHLRELGLGLGQVIGVS